MIIRYTNSYELIYIIVKFHLTLFIALPAFPTLDKMPSELYIWMPGWLQVIAAGVIIFSLFYFVILALEKTILPLWLPSYFYIRINLRVSISAEETKKISFLFDGSIYNRWYPLKEIKKIDNAIRKEQLFIAANEIARRHRIKQPF